MNNLTVVENNNNQVGEVIDYKQKAIEYLSSMGNTLPAKQQTQFLEMAQAFGLNPFKREIYAVGYGSNWNIITGYEVYIKRAERTGKMDGWEVTVEGSGQTLTSTITIYRKDWNKPFKHTVYYREVCQKTKEGKPTAIWDKMPIFMTKKVCMAQGFRLCFPDEFSGMPYTSDEMPSVEQMRDVTPVSEPTPQPTPEAPKKLYTTEQAKQIAEIVKTTTSDGKPVFTDEEKNTYRNMLKAGQFEIVLEDATSLLQNRLDLYNNPSKEITASYEELNNAGDLIF